MPKHQLVFNRHDKPTIKLMEYLCKYFDSKYPIEFIPVLIDTPILIIDGVVIASGAINIYQLFENERNDDNDLEIYNQEGYVPNPDPSHSLGQNFRGIPHGEILGLDKVKPPSSHKFSDNNAIEPESIQYIKQLQAKEKEEVEKEKLNLHDAVLKEYRSRLQK
jgi:hypothetical protein